MNLWKLILALAVVLLPGGSLVLLAMAAAKLLVAGRPPVAIRFPNP
ncbi:MAG TPA: hypothetical protein VGK67_00530 [Myxococcales bacterium]|jgi:hypothetical protein